MSGLRAVKVMVQCEGQVNTILNLQHDPTMSLAAFTSDVFSRVSQKWGVALSNDTHVVFKKAKGAAKTDAPENLHSSEDVVSGSILVIQMRPPEAIGGATREGSTHSSQDGDISAMSDELSKKKQKAEGKGREDRGSSAGSSRQGSHEQEIVGGGVGPVVVASKPQKTFQPFSNSENACVLCHSPHHTLKECPYRAAPGTFLTSTVIDDVRCVFAVDSWCPLCGSSGHNTVEKCPIATKNFYEDDEVEPPTMVAHYPIEDCSTETAQPGAIVLDTVGVEMCHFCRKHGHSAANCPLLPSMGYHLRKVTFPKSSLRYLDGEAKPYHNKRLRDEDPSRVGVFLKELVPAHEIGLKREKDALCGLCQNESDLLDGGRLHTPADELRDANTSHPRVKAALTAGVCPFSAPRGAYLQESSVEISGVGPRQIITTESLICDFCNHRGHLHHDCPFVVRRPGVEYYKRLGRYEEPPLQSLLNTTNLDHCYIKVSGRNQFCDVCGSNSHEPGACPFLTLPGNCRLREVLVPAVKDESGKIVKPELRMLVVEQTGPNYNPLGSESSSTASVVEGDDALDWYPAVGFNAELQKIQY